MARTVPFYWFREQDYDYIRGLIPNDPHLPASFAQWQQVANKQLAQIKAGGAAIQKIDVDPREFVAYCKAKGIEHSIAALGAFVLEQAKRPRTS
jgi:hypothetical protein